MVIPSVGQEVPLFCALELWVDSFIHVCKMFPSRCLLVNFTKTYRSGVPCLLCIDCLQTIEVYLQIRIYCCLFCVLFLWIIPQTWIQLKAFDFVSVCFHLFVMFFLTEMNFYFLCLSNMAACNVQFRSPVLQECMQWMRWEIRWQRQECLVKRDRRRLNLATAEMTACSQVTSVGLFAHAHISKFTSLVAFRSTKIAVVPLDWTHFVLFWL